jgi:hypothetical protein
MEAHSSRVSDPNSTSTTPSLEPIEQIQQQTDNFESDEPTMSAQQNATSNSTNSTRTNNQAGSNDQPVTTNPAISNRHFALFKSLRKLNSKRITARHHLDFLTSLKDKHLIPKGLQAKSINTGLELPPDLYEEWEDAHIQLGNSRRDILIRYWQRQYSELEVSIDTTQTRLNTTASPEELNHIENTLEKTRSARSQELKSRRLQKAGQRTADSGGENNQNQN